MHEMPGKCWRTILCPCFYQIFLFKNSRGNGKRNYEHRYSLWIMASFINYYTSFCLFVFCCFCFWNYIMYSDIVKICFHSSAFLSFLLIAFNPKKKISLSKEYERKKKIGNFKKKGKVLYLILPFQISVNTFDSMAVCLLQLQGDRDHKIEW